MIFANKKGEPRLSFVLSSKLLSWCSFSCGRRWSHFSSRCSWGGSRSFGCSRSSNRRCFFLVAASKRQGAEDKGGNSDIFNLHGWSLCVSERASYDASLLGDKRTPKL